MSQGRSWLHRRRVALAGIAAALSFGCAAYAWNLDLRDQFFPKRFAVVEPGALYRSAQISPRLIGDVLRDHSIGLVISLSDQDLRKPEHRAEKDAIDELGIEGRNIHLRGDGTGELEHYVDALEEISRAEDRDVPVLVHCGAGVHRTGAVLALYALLVEGRPAESAYREMVRFFGERDLEQSPLFAFLNENMATIAAGLVLRGVIDSVPDPLPALPYPS